MSFSFEATSYGVNFEWITEMDYHNSIENLEDALNEFDTNYHSTYELEVGTSRTYVFEIKKNKIYGEIHYTWDYSLLDSKHIDEYMNEIIKNEVVKILSVNLAVPKDEFENTYYYNISFSTIEKEGKFSINEWENDKKIKLPKTTWNSIREAIIIMANNHGANTKENQCQFIFQLNKSDSFINEYWQNEFNFENDELEFNLLNDNLKYLVE